MIWEFRGDILKFFESYASIESSRKMQQVLAVRHTDMEGGLLTLVCSQG